MKTDHLEQSGQATGDRATQPSLTDLFVRQEGQLKRVVAGMGIAATDAEDILQDVFIQASKWAGKLDRLEDAASWLMRVAINRCIQEFRRKKRFRQAVPNIQRRQSAVPSTDTASLNHAMYAREELAAMQDMLRELDESVLCPLVLRYFCGLDSVQVGEILDLPPSTVRSRLRDGRMILAKRLMTRGIGP